jgi:hypothetical protein
VIFCNVIFVEPQKRGHVLEHVHLLPHCPSQRQEVRLPK